MSESQSSKPLGGTTSAADVDAFINAPDEAADKPNGKVADKTDKTDKAEDEIKLTEDDDDKKIDLDEDEKPKKKKATDKEDKDEDDEDEDDDDIELEDEDEDGDDEDELEFTAPPRKRDITTKYPKFFKEFPWFEKMMYRDKQYTELFGSFDDAKEAYESTQVLSKFETDLGKGDTEKVLSSIKNNNKKAFDKVVDNYLMTLYKVDKDAYSDVVNNFTKDLIYRIYQEGKESGDEELQKLAHDLNKTIFRSSKWEAPNRRVSEKSDPDSEKDELSVKEQEFNQKRYQSTVNDLQRRVDNTLRSTIDQYIDPKGEMTPYIKKTAVKAALEMVHQNIDRDAAFQSTFKRVWKNVFDNDFNQGSQDRVRSTYLGRAKPILKAIINKARTEALKGLSPSSIKGENDDDKTEVRERKTSRSTGRPRPQSGKMERKPGESVYDFLSRSD